MPQDSANNYYYPLGTPGVVDQTIESEPYNTFLDDLVVDLNLPRPIHRGGTGTNNATAAVANLGAEKALQLVVNYDSHQFLPGSFYSAAGATGSPFNGHAFVGWVISSDPPATPIDNKNIILQARDQSDTTGSGRVYVREKRAGVWLNLAVNNGWKIDGTGIVGPTAPVNPPDNALWWDSESGALYVYYNDGNTKQWVIASPQPDTGNFILKTGDQMVGPLELGTPATAALHAVNKGYVDTYGTSIVNLANTKVPLVGNSTITGGITTTGGLAVGTNMTVGSTIVAGNRITSADRVKASENGGFFADDTASFFGFNGSPGFRQFYFNSVAMWQFNTANADLQWIASPFVPLWFRYADNSMIVSGQAYKPGGGDWIDSSDARIKNVEGDYARGLADVVQLRPVLYTYKGNDTSDAPAHILKDATGPVVVPYPNSPHHASATEGRKFAGLIAQEVETIIPEMVKQRSGYIDGAAVSDLRDLDTTPLIFALINAVKELKARVEELEGVT